MINIENLLIDEDFDEDFYERQLPEVVSYYENSQYTKRLRYYHHYTNYGQKLFRNIKELEKKITGDVEKISDIFNEDVHEKRHPEVKHYLEEFTEFIPKRKRYFHHFLKYCCRGGNKHVFSLDEDWADWDNLIFHAGKHIFRFEPLWTQYSTLIGKLVIENKLEEEIATSIDCSAPQKHYELMDVIDLPMLNLSCTPTPDLLRVFDSAKKQYRYVIYPFISFQDKGIRVLPALKPEQKNGSKVWDFNIINLKHRSDNLTQILGDIQGVSWLHPIRFEAIVAAQGYIGCFLSHLEILKQNLQSGKNVLIVEDDNIILDKEKLKKVLEILDSEVFSWDVFLGSVGLPTVELTGVVSVGDITFHNVTNVAKANFVYYNKSIISKFLKLEDFYAKFKSNLRYIDRFMNLFNVFTSDALCTVKNTFSEIENRPTRKEPQLIQFTHKHLLNKERQLYGLLPEDFRPSEYRELNPDLAFLSDEAASNHFLEFGLSERREYKFNLPMDFDCETYKILNPDLSQMPPAELKRHYSRFGCFENRKYKDPFFDAEYFRQRHGYSEGANLYTEYWKDIRQSKNEQFEKYVKSFPALRNQRYVFLVNHDNYGYGAGFYLYRLCNQLRQNFRDINFKICEVTYNSEIENRFNISRDDVLEYKEDPNLLYLLYEHFNPELIYLNSCNQAIIKILDYLPDSKLLLHSHEHYDDYLLSKRLTPQYVVSRRIAEQYLLTNEKQPKIQPPFLDRIETIYQRSTDEIAPISNQFGPFDAGKITIGMAGQLSERKNFNLFKQVSSFFPSMNFIWIGGESSYFDGLENVYHIKYTANPYKYFRNVIDYFVLFTLRDPCPYVILENILLGTQMITFRDNIFFDHNHPLIQDFYFEYPGEINLHNCINAIEHRVTKKEKPSTRNMKGGLKYIQDYFSVPKEIIRDFSDRFKYKNYSYVE